MRQTIKSAFFYLETFRGRVFCHLLKAELLVHVREECLPAEGEAGISGVTERTQRVEYLRELTKVNSSKRGNRESGRVSPTLERAKSSEIKPKLLMLSTQFCN